MSDKDFETGVLRALPATGLALGPIIGVHSVRLSNAYPILDLNAGPTAARLLEYVDSFDNLRLEVELEPFGICTRTISSLMHTSGRMIELLLGCLDRAHSELRPSLVVNTPAAQQNRRSVRPTNERSSNPQEERR